MRLQRTESRRLERERRTIRILVGLYWKSAHRDAIADKCARGGHPFEAGLCPDCAALYAYAVKRIERCRFGSKKPVCAKCPVHCYAPAMRTQIQRVMRYSGPRMLLTHPLLAIHHMIDRVKRVPPTPRPSV